MSIKRSQPDTVERLKTAIEKNGSRWSDVRNEARERHRERYWRHRSKASYQCPDCGRRGDHPHIRRLEVHHKDGNPLNGRMANLVGLCQHCHHRRHGFSTNTDLEDWKARIHHMEEHV